VELEDDGPPVRGGQDDATAMRDLEGALRAVPESFRTAVVLRDLEDMSYAEIAVVLEVPLGTVMSRIHRGRALIRAILSGRKD
jgi:RNA polymerase sigma-70 factor (ECF subfamily)